VATENELRPDEALAVFLGVRPLQPREFRMLRNVIEDVSGIHLSEDKRALLVGRLTRRLRELHVPNFTAYHARIVGGDDDELVHMLDRISTNETHFFREPRQFDFLRREVFPGWARQARLGERPTSVRAWSAASSTGEEVYTLAMVMLDAFPRGGGWHIDILGTDLSTRVLARAREATWPLEKASEIPPEYLRRYMMRGRQRHEGLMRAGTALREVTRFERVNLNAATYDVKGPFDLIFCRNVLIYFSSATRRRVVEQLLRHLAPGGYLFVGHAESLIDEASSVTLVGPGVYRAAAGAAGRAAERVPGSQRS
jgi:chemotaxis protein methyltransferase CheR